MTTVWSVRFGRVARRDLIAILKVSSKTFGVTQASRYKSLVMISVGDLGAGPNAPNSIARDDIAPRYRSLHIAWRGRRGRHLLLYRAAGPTVIEIVRILHDSMDIARHLPGP